ncbi:hypothetical protein [Paramaledivibacter caminithermalis]|jgi:hypothetical protein|uniref:Uncharacterized protein n=1 Tax=Paramaledivibacter caminithermalis (strain DSM 15212 / CIP 107654 / DViRD3) TaxID=1121301 RepID=A0A1M6MHC7_PARC5|nr:hypothetical protein [Paramaledivibacter caminithermalis]SHJ82919.1 hypothetical protein SAMN02745912_01257 [Paramaledivibacter caminithermalis DSM 15212]
MNKEKQKINGIICKFLILLLEKKATDISIKIAESQLETKIEISSEEVFLDKDTIHDIKKILSMERTLEIESLYWGLIGSVDNICSIYNLHIVANMIDDVETYYSDNKFKIVLCRKK